MLALAVCTLGGCGTTAGLGPRLMHLGPEPYRIGDLRIWILPQPEVEMLCRLRRPDLSEHVRVYGCYIPATRAVLAIEDAWVVLHELKHYFDGDWHE